MIRRPPRSTLSSSSAASDVYKRQERLRAFHEHFGNLPTYLGTFDFAWGQEAAAQILRDGLTSATLVVAADVISLGLLSVLQGSGHRVPEDFRVVSFDGIGVARLAHPTLTTVRQPVELIGSTILELIRGASSAEHRPLTIRVTPEPVSY